ncbi:hypothetical protein U1Q18_035115 [Sarracenia purpurea var. burkii]
MESSNRDGILVQDHGPDMSWEKPRAPIHDMPVVEDKEIDEEWLKACAMGGLGCRGGVESAWAAGVEWSWHGLPPWVSHPMSWVTFYKFVCWFVLMAALMVVSCRVAYVVAVLVFGLSLMHELWVGVAIGLECKSNLMVVDGLLKADSLAAVFLHYNGLAKKMHAHGHAKECSEALAVALMHCIRLAKARYTYGSVKDCFDVLAAEEHYKT